MWKKIAILAAIGTALVSGVAFAQANQDISFADFQFNRSLPGARSLALGGSFVALADDATAAFSNPAGLTKLPATEFSLEYRRWSSKTRYPESGRLSGEVSNEGVDIRQGLEIASTTSATEDISFASIVFRPARAPRLAVALYRHIYADFSSHVESQGVFIDGQPPRFGPYVSDTKFKVDSVGLGFGYQIGNCVELKRCFRVGGTLSGFSLDLATSTLVLADPPPNGHGPADFTAPSVARASTAGNDDALGGTVGILWQPNPSWGIGVAYRLSPRFQTEENVFSGPRKASLRLPDQVAVGVSFRPLGTGYTYIFEYDRVDYSVMTEGNGLALFEIADAEEFRLGIERQIRVGNPVYPWVIALMAGAWYDPDHRVRVAFKIGQPTDLFREAYFGLPASNDLHGSFGAAISRGSWQFDLSADVSSQTRTVAVAFIKRL